jgi:hypothetical protein
MSSWHSYSKIFNLGHVELNRFFEDPVLVEEKVDGCVTPETPILTADLTYVKAGDLKVGDVLLAFTEKLNGAKLKESVVTASLPIKKECYEIKLSDGREVTASSDHPWVVRQKTNNNGKVYINTQG